MAPSRRGVAEGVAEGGEKTDGKGSCLGGGGSVMAFVQKGEEHPLGSEEGKPEPYPRCFGLN